MRRALSRLLALASLCTALAACGGDDATSARPSTTLTVFAASSLTGTFGVLEKAFEKDHPSVDVVVSFDSSSTLATQVTQGAPADVIATADQASMQTVVGAGDNAAEPVPFASNTMIIVTPPDNPGEVSSLDDLATTDFVLCDRSAPCGAVAAQIFSNAGITPHPVSFEDKVTAVLSVVQLGEADGGLVYVTDALAAGAEVRSIALPDSINVATPYFITAVKDSSEPELAAQWIDLVTSEAGRGVLKAAGFGLP